MEPDYLSPKKPVNSFLNFIEHVEHNDLDAVREALLSEQFSIEDRDERFGLNRTALHVAAGFASEDTFSMLLDYGYDPKAVDSEGRTVLYYAIFSWANIESTLNKGDTWKAAPVQEVTNPRAVEIVRSLLCDSETAHPFAVAADGSTAFHCAAMVGNPEIFSMILSIQDDINRVDGMQRTALHLAVWADREEIVQQLLSRQANVHLRNKIGRTPLHVAAVYGRTSICRRLLKAGADVDSQAESGDSCLMSSLKDRFLETSRLFVEDGANELLCNKEGDHPLSQSIKNFPELAYIMLNRRRKVTGSQIYGDRCEASYDFTDLDVQTFPNLPILETTNIPAPRKKFGQRDSVPRRVFSAQFLGELKPTPLELIVAVPSGDLTLLSHPVIIKLLEEKWKTFASRHFYAQAVRYLVLLLLWMFVNSTNTPHVYEPPYVRLVLEILVILWCLFTLITTARQFSGPIRKKLQQLMGWNGYIMLTSLLILPIVPLRVVGMYSVQPDLIVREHELMALASLLVWCYLLRFLSVVHWTGAFIRMIARMIHDVLKFMFVFLFVLAGFGQAFYIIFRGIDASHDLMEMDHQPHEFSSLPQAVMTCFRLMTGNFDFDALSQSDQWLPFALYVLFVLIATFLMANLLLAMMQSTYEEVKKNSELQWRLNWATEIVRIESQLSRKDRQKFRDKIGTNISATETVNLYKKLTVDDCYNLIKQVIHSCEKSESSQSIRFSKIDEKLLHVETALVPARLRGRFSGKQSVSFSRRGSNVGMGGFTDLQAGLQCLVVPEDSQDITSRQPSPQQQQRNSLVSQKPVSPMLLDAASTSPNSRYVLPNQMPRRLSPHSIGQRTPPSDEATPNKMRLFIT